MTVPVVIISLFAYFTDVILLIMFVMAVLMKNMSVEGAPPPPTLIKTDNLAAATVKRSLQWNCEIHFATKSRTNLL